MILRLENLTEEYARQICNWRYEGDYGIYNYPQWNIIRNQGWGITLEEKRMKEFVAVIEDEMYLCGYMRLVEHNEYVLIGIGLKPVLCGQGIGKKIIELLKTECMRRFGNKNIILEVRSFNSRAIKCYEKAGFKKIEEYQKKTPIGTGEFIRMEYSWKPHNGLLSVLPK